jgi:hypothetical protein
MLSKFNFLEGGITREYFKKKKDNENIHTQIYLNYYLKQKSLFLIKEGFPLLMYLNNY